MIFGVLVFIRRVCRSLQVSSSPLPTFSSSLSSLSSRTVFSSRAAGVDVHEADALGGLSLTDEGLIRREALVLDTVVGRGIPIAGFVGGGYDADTLVPYDRVRVVNADP